jgi:hypothetical protein
MSGARTTMSSGVREGSAAKRSSRRSRKHFHLPDPPGGGYDLHRPVAGGDPPFRKTAGANLLPPVEEGQDVLLQVLQKSVRGPPEKESPGLGDVREGVVDRSKLPSPGGEQRGPPKEIRLLLGRGLFQCSGADHIPPVLPGGVEEKEIHTTPMALAQGPEEAKVEGGHSREAKNG